MGGGGYNETKNLTQNKGEGEAEISGSSLTQVQNSFLNFCQFLRLGEHTDCQEV